MSALPAGLLANPIFLGMALCALVIISLLLGRLWGRSSRRASSPLLSNSEAKARTASEDAFRKGLTHLMADHTDQAIEEFSRAVTLNSDTVETYVVLGNLFRQKGEIERAVRIRQSIIARPNLNPSVRLQALFDLGLDFRKGGLFNRAVEAFQEVLTSDSHHVEALRQTVSLFEEMREWDRAFDALKRLDKLTGEDNRLVLAHYKTEQGKEFMAGGQLERAEEALEQAMGVHKGCLDAYLHLGDLELLRERVRKALGIWRKAVRIAPEHAHLVVNRVAAAEPQIGDKTAQTFYEEIDPQASDVTTLLALAERFHVREMDDKALTLLDLALRKDPRQLGAHRLRGQILLAHGQNDQALSALSQLLDQVSCDPAAYQCNQCGFVSHQLTWKCPRCHQWDTMTPRIGGA